MSREVTARTTLKRRRKGDEPPTHGFSTKKNINQKNAHSFLVRVCIVSSQRASPGSGSKFGGPNPA
jgi:ribosomal protein S30